MPRMFIFGLGYTAKRIAAELRLQGWEVIGTGRDGDLAFEDHGTVRAALADASHVLSSVPPGGDGLDPAIENYGDALAGKWLGYLSSTGVYGDCGGAWVDETAALVGSGGKGRRTARAEADSGWLARGARVFRLPGIYGPSEKGQGGRNALDRVRSGKAHRIDLPDQVFSRIHVDDIVSGVLAGLGAPAGAYNLSDDLPCNQNVVITEACRLLNVPLPPLQQLGHASLSSQARAFYAENRRVANGKAKRIMDWKLRYPTWREGLHALI